MVRLLLAVGLAGALSTTAMAQSFDPSSTPREPTESTSSGISTTSAADDTDPNKVICRSVRPPTGTRVKSSRTRTKVCMTKSEWDIQNAEAQEQARNASNKLNPRDGQ